MGILAVYVQAPCFKYVAINIKILARFLVAPLRQLRTLFVAAGEHSVIVPYILVAILIIDGGVIPSSVLLLAFRPQIVSVDPRVLACLFIRSGGNRLGGLYLLLAL